MKNLTEKKIVVFLSLVILMVVALIFFLDNPKVVLEDLSGMNATEVKKYATVNNIKLVVEREYNDEVEKGLVIRQSVAEGETIRENDKVIVYLSRGPAQ